MKPSVVVYSPEALAFLDTRHGDASLGKLLDAVLTEFENDPDDQRWRRKAYQGLVPRVFVFEVRGHADTVVVLWQRQSETSILVHYIGAPV